MNKSKYSLIDFKPFFRSTRFKLGFEMNEILFLGLKAINLELLIEFNQWLKSTVCKY